MNNEGINGFKAFLSQSQCPSIMIRVISACLLAQGSASPGVTHFQSEHFPVAIRPSEFRFATFVSSFHFQSEHLSAATHPSGSQFATFASSRRIFPGAQQIPLLHWQCFVAAKIDPPH